jgi:hypothetical protein
MTDTVIMEELSKSYLETIANRTGYFNSVSRDYGTDLTIRKANLCPTRKRYLTTGKAIDFQVKAVSDKYVLGIDDPNRSTIKYNLEVKNYNDLIDRTKENGRIIPLILIVFILPKDKPNWLTYTPEQLILKRCAFWYQIPAGLTHTNNRTKTMIEIPKTNIISMSFFDEQFAKLDI